MAIIQLVLASVILGVIYIRMIKREQPSPIPVVQAVLPVAGGMASVPVSFMMFLRLSSLFMSIGISLKQRAAAGPEIDSSGIFRGRAA